VRRFWREATAAPAEGGFEVRLDGRPVRTPARRHLLLPTAALAEAVAEEWQRQGGTIEPPLMPLTRLASTVIDLMPARREDVVLEVAGYAGTDLLCYRALGPRELCTRQEAAWRPWLDWALRELDAGLRVTAGVAPLAQPEPAERAILAVVRRLDPWRLVGLHAATTLTGSVVLGLALERGALGATEAFAVALLDELYEIEQWGREEQQQRRHASLRRDLEAAERFLRLLEA
jgi:chaperone required for assembly of F1-ATPase